MLFVKFSFHFKNCDAEVIPSRKNVTKVDEYVEMSFYSVGCGKFLQVPLQLFFIPSDIFPKGNIHL